MSASEILPFTQWADIHRNEKFLSLVPLSGYRMIRPEDDGHFVYLAPDASDEALGRALREALDKSRFISPDDCEFIKAERYERANWNWHDDLIRRYGYKTGRDAYATMDWCRVKRTEGKIAITPNLRDNP